MKKLLLLFGGLMLVPLVSLTAGQSSPPILDNSSSFQVAEAVKLGLSDEGLALRPKKALSGEEKLDGDDGNFEEFCGKGYYYDKVSKACKLKDVCNPNNPCSGTTPICEPAGDGINYTCLCNDTSCGPGKTCTGGKCNNCQKGEKCNCPGNQVSDGNGGCYTPNDTCNPNPCPAEMPSCSALDETQYSCSCTSTSCPPGKKCEDMTCQPCSAGEDCGCKASGKEADGNGGCRCPGMKISDGAGGCKCPECYAPDGTWGGCKKTCDCVTCAKAKKCVDGECVNCPLGEDCGCFDDDAYSNGSGVCEPNDPCADVTCESDEYCSEGTCYPSPCPSGYDTSVTSCSEGYTLETNGTSGGSTCGKCVAKSCPSGYSTSVTSCSDGQKLETNGMSGDSACGKCVSAGDPCKTEFGSNYVASTVRTCGSDAKTVKKTTSSGVTCIGCIPCNCSASYMSGWDEAEGFYHLPGDPNCHGATLPSVTGTIMDYVVEGNGKTCDSRPCWKCVPGCPSSCKNKNKGDSCSFGQKEKPCSSASYGSSHCFICSY